MFSGVIRRRNEKTTEEEEEGGVNETKNIDVCTSICNPQLRSSLILLIVLHTNRSEKQENKQRDQHNGSYAMLQSCRGVGGAATVSANEPRSAVVCKCVDAKGLGLG